MLFRSAELPQLKDYLYFDELGNLYGENDELLAYVENFAEVFAFSFETDHVIVDGTKYYSIEPDEGYPEEFAYFNDYGKIFDRELNYLLTFDEYEQGMYWGEPQPTPAPRLQVDTGYIMAEPTPKTMPVDVVVDGLVPTMVKGVKPIIVEVDTVMTAKEYELLYNEAYDNVIVQGYIPLEMSVEDGYSALFNLVMDYAENENYQNNAIGLGLGGLILLLFLIVAAGKRNEDGEYVAGGMGRMPWDLWLAFWCGVVALIGCGVYGMCYLTVEALQYNYTDILNIVDSGAVDIAIKLCIAVAAVCMAVLVLTIHSIAARVKVKGWWRNCLCGKVLVWCWKLCVKCAKLLWKLWKRVWNGCKSFVSRVPLVWKAAVVLGVIMLVEILFCAAIPDGSAALGMLLSVIKFLVCMIICLMLKRLQQGARTIADGDLDHRIDTKNLYLDFKEHAECLNRIGDGLSHNVDARLRSERMKTELITNVSHDLKTPLTSIVNYVDLLKKEELSGNAAEYVAVLDRQSARLKKLTEDLVEASKASSGALSVNVERVNMAELLEQAQAEYARRLADCGLQPILRQLDGEMNVWADGRYVWRIMDNLLSNVCKYAMANTRVYLELRNEGDFVVLSVKNMSRESLNISAEELMERFVRGDSSRNTEGSGLGLSIAQNLAKLMGGEVRITIDGDLFKADVMLPVAK